MKLKHNKKRNTAFLYEALVKELTKAIVNKDVEGKLFCWPNSTKGVGTY